MSDVELESYAQRLYDDLAPLHEDDANEGFTLKKLVGALGAPHQLMDDLVQEGPNGEPGWSVILDADRVPAYALPWLAQFVGAELPPIGELITNYVHIATNMVPNPGAVQDTWGVRAQQGTLASDGVEPLATLASFNNTLASTGDTSIDFYRDDTPTRIIVETGKTYYFRVTGMARKASESNPLAIIGTQTPALEWYNAGGGLISTSAPAARNITNDDDHLYTYNAVAPAGAVTVRPRLKTTGLLAGDHMWADGAMLSLENSVFFDGFTPTPGKLAHWMGLPHRSQSELLDAVIATETEEQYTARRRDIIKQAPSWKRGTPAAIKAAVKAQLTGGKTVILRERLGGAYKLSIYTYAIDTPDADRVLAAILTQKPGGITLTYAVHDMQDYQQLLTNHATYDAIWAYYGTYQGIATDLPGE